MSAPKEGRAPKLQAVSPCKIEIIKNDDIQTDLCDLPFIRNQPLKSHNDWYSVI